MGDQPEEFGDAYILENHEDGSIPWLRQRQKGIGGSDAAVCLGLKPYGTDVVDLWRKKTGREEPDTGNVATRFGSKLEPYLRERAALLPETEYDAPQIPDTFDLPNHMRHQDRAWQRANIDGLVIGKGGDVLGGLEIKTSKYPFDSFDGDCKEIHYAQIQHYMAVTGLERWWYVYSQIPFDRRSAMQIDDLWVPSDKSKGYWEWIAAEGNLHVTLIDRHEAYIANLIDKERTFWGYVESDEAPDLEGEREDEKDLSEDSSLSEMFAQYAQLKANIDATDSVEAKGQYEEKAEKAKGKIKTYLNSVPGNPKKVQCGPHGATWNARGYWMLYPADVDPQLVSDLSF